MNRVVRYAPVTGKYSHNSILFRKVLDDRKRIEVPAGYEFRLAGPEDLSSIIAHPEALAAAVYAKRLASGDQCYCLSDGTGIVSYNWVARAHCCVLCGYDRGLEFFPLGTHQVFTYDFYTYRARRGGGLGSLAKNLLIQALGRESLREVYTLIMPYSTASLRIHLRLGYEPLCIVYGYRMLGWNRTFYGKPGHKHWLDAWISDFKVSAGIG
jgi:L-amino acid N-acyltransferase YncA